MPTIPRLETKSSVPAAPEFRAMPSVTNAAVGKALEEGGATMFHLGNEMAEYDRRATAADKVLQYTEAKQNFAADIDNLKATFAERTDYDNFEADYNKAAQEIHQKHLSSVTYPDVQKKVAPYLDLNLQRGLISVKAHGRQLRTATLEAKSDTLIDRMMEDYVVLRRNDPDEATRKMSEIEMQISEMESTGAYKPEKAERMRREIPRAADMLELGKDIDNAKTPEDVAIISKALDDPKQYSNLKAADRLKFKDTARGHANVLWNERNKAQHELRENVALQAFYLERDNKIPIAKKVAQIEAWMKPDPITGVTAMSVASGQSIINRLEKPEGGTQGKTDPNTWADLFDRMHSDDPKERPSTQEILKARQQGKLSESDYEQFVKQTVVLKNQDKKAKSAEESAFRKEQSDLYKEQQTLIKGLYSKDKKELIPYMLKRIDQQISMFKTGSDINKMRRETELYTQSLIDYAEGSSKGGVIKQFKEQFQKEFASEGPKEPEKGQQKEQSTTQKVSVSSTPKELPKAEEEKFQQWYKGWADKTGMNKNPDDENQKYDYRAAYKAGVVPPEKGGHWPSEYKHLDHPNRIIKGIDTATGKVPTYEVLWAQVATKGSSTKGKEWLMAQGWSEAQAIDIIKQGLAQRKIK